MNILLTPIDKLESKLKFWKRAGMTGIIAGVVSMTYVWSQQAEVAMLRASNKEIATELLKIARERDGITAATANGCVAWQSGTGAMMIDDVCVRIRVDQ